MSQKIVSLLIGIVVALGSGGCVATVAKNDVVKTASFDHDCPLEKVQITKKADGIFAYELDVCGQRRKYRDFGDKGFRFVDVTDGMPQQLPAE